MSERKYIIPATSIDEAFQKHLELNENKRILFSAPFGSGKSYFLKEFFGVNTEHLTVKLHPVDYAVSSNEDIFELIKHDLLIELLDKFYDDIELKKDDVSYLVAGQILANSKLNVFPFIKALAKLIEPTGVSGEITDEVNKGLVSIQNMKDDLAIDEEMDVLAYLKKERFRAGSIREMDGITGSIKDFIQRVRIKNGNKQVVLVVDDMDRLDPDHMFRLFNIFTAHYDSRTEENKFGFDKVIFVADIENIKHVFSHKFGPFVDFKGYINKFYSREVFNFDFKTHLKESIIDILVHKFSIDPKKHFGIQRPNGYSFNTKEDFSIILQYFIEQLIAIDSINIRSFEKLLAYRIPMYEIRLMNGRLKDVRSCPFLVLMSIVKQFYPRLSDLSDDLQRLYRIHPSDYSTGIENQYFDEERLEIVIINYCLPFCFPDYQILTHKKKSTLLRIDNEKGVKLELTLTTSGDGTAELTNLTLDNKLGITGGPCLKPNPFWFMYIAFENSVKRNFIQ